MIDRLTEDESTAPSEKQNDQLQPLQWIIGQWSDEVDGQQVNIECNWSYLSSPPENQLNINGDHKIKTSYYKAFVWSVALAVFGIFCTAATAQEVTRYVPTAEANIANAKVKTR